MAIVTVESERVASVAGSRLGERVVPGDWGPARDGWHVRTRSPDLGGLDATLAAHIVEHHVTALRLEVTGEDIARIVALKLVDDRDREWAMPSRPVTKQGRTGSTTSSTERRFWLRLDATVRIEYPAQAAPRARVVAVIAVAEDRYPSLDERRTERDSAQTAAYEALLDKIVGPSPRPRRRTKTRR